MTPEQKERLEHADDDMRKILVCQVLRISLNKYCPDVAARNPGNSIEDPRTDDDDVCLDSTNLSWMNEPGEWGC
jgi:hypothetical protein